MRSKRLKRAGVSKTVMLTGDRRNVAEAVAKEIGLDEVHAQLLPGDKVDAVESMMKFLPESKNWLLLVMALMMHRCFQGGCGNRYGKYGIGCGNRGCGCGAHG